MKQLRQMSILVRGAQLLLLVLALFLVVWPQLLVIRDL